MLLFTPRRVEELEMLQFWYQPYGKAPLMEQLVKLSLIALTAHQDSRMSYQFSQKFPNRKIPHLVDPDLAALE